MCVCGVRVCCVLREDYDYEWERVRVWLGVIYDYDFLFDFTIRAVDRGSISIVVRLCLSLIKPDARCSL